MELYEITQIMLIATGGIIFARLGLALARRIERRPVEPVTPAPGEDRLRALEAECAVLRQELGEVQERQDFTERLLLPDPKAGGVPEKRVPTPR